MSPDSSRRADIAKRLMDIQASNPVNEPMIHPTSDSSKQDIKDYTISNLFEDWNHRKSEMFPPFWGMQEANDGELLFSFNGDIVSQITRSILVKKDMSIEVSLF